jgi:hypothetical protein
MTSSPNSDVRPRGKSQRLTEEKEKGLAGNSDSL